MSRLIFTSKEMTGSLTGDNKSFNCRKMKVTNEIKIQELHKFFLQKQLVKARNHKLILKPCYILVGPGSVNGICRSLSPELNLF